MLRQITKSCTLKRIQRLYAVNFEASNYYSNTTLHGQIPETSRPLDIPIKKQVEEYTSSSSSDDSDSSSSESSDSNGENNHRQKSTYIEEEVNKFRSMANEWWNPLGDAKPLHSLNRLRVSLVRDGIIQSGLTNSHTSNVPQPLKGLKILDVGCGGGIMCEPLARLGAKVVGVDALEENVAVARLHADKDPRVKHNVTYISSTLEDHAESLKGEQYDVIIASEILEHIDAIEFFIQTCSDVLKSGGSFFLTTINKTQASWLGAIVVAEYALRLLPTGTHDWNKFIPEKELLFLLERNGFSTRLVHGMAYNPLTNNWFWTSQKCINYAVHAVKTT